LVDLRAVLNDGEQRRRTELCSGYRRIKYLKSRVKGQLKGCKHQQFEEIAMQNTAAAENNPRASQSRDLREIRGSDLIVSSVSINVVGEKQSVRGGGSRREGQEDTKGRSVEQSRGEKRTSRDNNTRSNCGPPCRHLMLLISCPAAIRPAVEAD